MKNKKDIINSILTRSIDNVVSKESLEKKLSSDKKLRIKFGIDPTSPNIHLGRAIPILKLKKFQELGHQIVLIIGDFTGVIGDTSDKDAERPMLSKEQVKENLKTYIEQFSKLVDIDKAEIRYNSEWLSKLSYGELSEQANVFSVNEFISRSNIKDRLDKGGRVSLREVFYPLMQGYDSVAIESDVELGGADQWFNLLAGRTLQKHYGQKPQDILTNILIEGLDGRKMSSSWGNTINLTDEPKEMFGKVMSMKDEQIITYFMHCTEVPLEEIKQYTKELKKGANPIDIKDKLAFEITRMYWGEKGAKEGQEHFNSVVRDKKKPTDIKELVVKAKNIIDVLVETKLLSSKSEARRMVNQKGVKINDKVVDSLEEEVKRGDIVQKGKRNIIKIK